MKRLVIGLLRGYQKLTPAYRRGYCRFIPTCSQYAVTAVSRFGVIGGGLLAVWRVLRCNPLSKGGFDEVPERFLFFGKRGKKPPSQNDGTPSAENL